MKLSRRNLLAAGLGVGQLALLEKFGLIREARAQSVPDAPTKLLTVYLQGGTRQHYQWWPLAPSAVDNYVPAPTDYEGEPAFFTPAQITTLAPGDGQFPALQMPKLWSDTDPSTRAPGVTPMGYAWPYFNLQQQTSVLHGVNQGTAAHASGYIACMCGVAGASYRAPALQSVIANHFYTQFQNQRPLPCVAVKSSGMPDAMNLPAVSAPILVPGVDSLTQTLSDDPASNSWWKGLNVRTAQPELAFDGTTTGGTTQVTNLEGSVLSAVRGFKGRSTKGTDALLEQLYGGYSSVSRVLARDVTTLLKNTVGVQYVNNLAYLSGYAGDGPFGFHFGQANYYESGLNSTLDIVLRLLKSDLATAVHAFLDEIYFDTHNGMTGHRFNSAMVRAEYDVIGRMLGEMKMTAAPGKPGKTLLDDTLVMIISEFSRSWASGPGQANMAGWSADDGHFPFTTVAFVGGGVAANHAVGSYEPPDMSGVPVDMIDSSGSPATRPPMASDVTATACRIMGLNFSDFFIPGGYGEVVGIRKV